MRGERLRAVTAAASARDSIQRAIDSLGGGGVVYLEPGTYRLDRTVQLPTGVSVIGAGPRRTVLELAQGSNCHAFTNADWKDGNEAIELRGFTIAGTLGSKQRRSDAPSGLFACGGYFKRARDVVIDNIDAKDIRQTAFHFTLCTHVEIRRLTADRMGWSGVSTSGTSDIELHDVIVTGAGLDVRHSGIHLDGGAGAFIDAVVEDCTGNGIMLDAVFSAMTDAVVRGTVRHSLRGVSLTGSYEHELVNVCVTGDYSDNQECGVLVSNASNVFVIDSTVASNGKAGVVLQGGAGAEHCVLADCRITGSPELLVERDRNHFSYVTSTTTVPKVAPEERGRPRERERPSPTTPPPAATPAVDDPLEADSYAGICNVCGESQTFARRNTSLREGYRCQNCKASLRYRGQADALLRKYSEKGALSISDLVEEPHFAELRFWEPGVLGPFRTYFTRLPNYVTTDYLPGVKPGDEQDGTRCEDIMALTFPNESFDLIVTSDIFEHVRHPLVGFAEIHRVLRPGGRHIFSIPVQAPMATRTVERVDTSGPEDVHILEPRYHLGPGNSQHLVYNDFGSDLVDRLGEIGLETEVIAFEAPNPEASRLLTFCSLKC
jgi:SAM-dependent methyltransferase